MSISLYETYFYILCLHIIQSLILWPLKPKTALTLTAVCTSQKGNINNFIFIGGSVLWLQASYIYPGYSVSEAIFFTFKWLVSFYFFFHGFQFFLLHVCMQVHKVYTNCFYADRSGMKRGRPLSSDTFQMSDCNTSSLKWPFTGVLLDS